MARHLYIKKFMHNKDYIQQSFCARQKMISSMPKSSSGSLNISYVRVQWVDGKFGVGVEARRACGNRAVDSHHGTGMEGAKGYQHR